MSWTAIGAVGELLGALAVVFTVAYLARQVRETNRLARAEAYRAIRTLHVQISGEWANDPAWLAVVARLVRGARREDLSDEQRWLAAARYDQMLAALAAVHHEVENGNLPESAYDLLSWRNFKVPYMSDIWPFLKEDYPESFVAFFESFVQLTP